MLKFIFFLFLKSIVYTNGFFLNPGDTFKSKAYKVADSTNISFNLNIWFPEVYTQLVELNVNDKSIINLVYDPTEENFLVQLFLIVAIIIYFLNIYC